MKTILTISSLFILNFCIAQTSDTICDLQAKNSKWKESFENVQTKSDRITLAKQKIFSDSIYSDYNAGFKNHEVIYRTADKSGNDCGCRIFFHLYFSNQSLVLNVSQNKYLKPIVEALSDSNIDEIISLFDEKSAAVYGTFGKCGVVLLKTKNKKFIQFVKKTLQ